MDVKLTKAFVKSIKAYFAGHNLDNYSKASGKPERKFTKEYLEGVGKEFGKKDPKSKDKKFEKELNKADIEPEEKPKMPSKLFKQRGKF